MKTNCGNEMNVPDSVYNRMKNIPVADLGYNQMNIPVPDLGYNQMNIQVPALLYNQMNVPFRAPFNNQMNVPFRAPFDNQMNVPAHAPINNQMNVPVHAPLNVLVHTPVNNLMNVPVNNQMNVSVPTPVNNINVSTPMNDICNSKCFTDNLNDDKMDLNNHNEIQLTALETAIPDAIIIAELLEKTGFAAKTEVLTSKVYDNPADPHLDSVEIQIRMRRIAH